MAGEFFAESVELGLDDASDGGFVEGFELLLGVVLNSASFVEVGEDVVSEGTFLLLDLAALVLGELGVLLLAHLLALDQGHELDILFGVFDADPDLSAPLFEQIEEYMTEEEIALSLSTPGYHMPDE